MVSIAVWARRARKEQSGAPRVKVDCTFSDQFLLYVCATRDHRNHDRPVYGAAGVPTEMLPYHIAL